MAVVLASDHKDAKAVWAIFGPAVGWSFIGTGLYAWRRRPESRTGALMVLLGFAWFLYTLDAANSPLVYTFALVTGPLWGGVFLHLGAGLPVGPAARAGSTAGSSIAGYVIFPLAFVPALLFAGPHELGCDDCPENLLLIRDDADLAGSCSGSAPRSTRRSSSSCSCARSRAGAAPARSSGCSSRRSTSARC